MLLNLSTNNSNKLTTYCLSQDKWLLIFKSHRHPPAAAPTAAHHRAAGPRRPCSPPKPNEKQQLAS
jgi:hypothetical protein